MPAPIDSRSWRDWVLFAAAYGVIMGAIFFAYPPGQSPVRHEASVSQGAALR
ncbi:hypothetical protein [Azorhizobium doebereinerae]|uniref:hypothetical protein n=1 Tax=Azorhizobium doebereinerae TaxID=281091 RepID=UPI00040C0CF8|nr:hypothetical protein [Azorhizobium doebereinerae]